VRVRFTHLSRNSDISGRSRFPSRKNNYNCFDIAHSTELLEHDVLTVSRAAAATLSRCRGTPEVPWPIWDGQRPNNCNIPPYLYTYLYE
jgi:hypothetical protein